MKFIYFVLLIFSFNACQKSSSSSYIRSEHSLIAEKITLRTAEKIESETGLSLIGTGGSMMDCVKMMALSFECLGEITLEQGRELLIYCMNQYLSAINSNEPIRPHLAHYPFTPKDIQIRIFVTRIDRREVPLGAIAVVAAIDGILDYDTKQPGLPSIRQVHEETYEEAIKILETQGTIDKVRKNSKSREKI